ncbi:MAG: hypothetical protein AB1756_08350 [Acidobacteriota bacterium]
MKAKKARICILDWICSLILIYFPVFMSLIALGLSWATVIPEENSRFDQLVIHDPSTRLGIVAETPESITGFEHERAGWEVFIKSHGGIWKVYIDRRSGSPTLVEGQGIRWFHAEGSTLPPILFLNALEAKAREFVSENTALLKVQENELILNRQASSMMDRDHWILVFDRVVNGIPVENQRFILYITRGNLVSFGADQWGILTPGLKGVAKEPFYDAASAREFLYAYMGITSADSVQDVEPERLIYLSVPPEGNAEGEHFNETSNGPYKGPVGEGVNFRLAWCFMIRIEGERGIWVGKVDATTGEIIAFYDDVKYTRVKGGIYPMSNDGSGWEGTEQPGFPMPYADVTVNGQMQTCNDMGLFTPGPSNSQAITTLNGPYVKIYDVCGVMEESRPADEDLDLKTGSGTDCATPHRTDSDGDTHATRTSFYHVNRAKERGRYWLPDNNWLRGKLEVVTNQGGFNTCNAYWNGSINLFQSMPDQCRNFGEISAVAIHEWGHGMDQNDGGGYDNPSEAYADIVAIIYDRNSCLARGGRFSNCSGYGDTCLNCTGIRELDWDKRASHTPATADGFVNNNCGGGGGPCGREVHCEGHLAAETIWDLATRDLPAAGLDTYTSHQLTEKLFYKSRKGSGGNAYNCSIPYSDGCGAGTWFTKLRNTDDDDGNLSNGTPHAAAIFAAFSRHKIACGAASDSSNQNHSSCPSLATPTLSVTPGCSSAKLTWGVIPNAASYVVLRNDQKCDASSIIIGTVKEPDTAFIDYDLPGGFPLYYRVQAQGANAACDGAVSNCVSVIPNAGTLTAEVTGVTVTKTSATHLNWTSQSDATKYDVAGGMLSELLLDRTFTRASCLADDITQNQWDDTRNGPPVGECYYYLVRSENSCGPGTYGWKSNGNERIISSCP